MIKKECVDYVGKAFTYLGLDVVVVAVGYYGFEDGALHWGLCFEYATKEGEIKQHFIKKELAYLLIPIGQSCEADSKNTEFNLQAPCLIGKVR